MATKKFKIGITRILDAWNAEVDIVNYRNGKDRSLEIYYRLTDSTSTVQIAPRWIADWFGGRFVEWAWDETNALDGMVIEKEVR